AMALAFDYEALRSTLKITDTISSGKPARGPLPAGVPGYDASLPFPKRDLAAAKAALARSKYANQLGSIVIDMAWVAEVPAEEKMALLFQQNMAELGVKVNITKVPWTALTERFARPETTPNLYPLFTGLSYPDPDGLLYIMYSSKAAGTFWSSSWLKDAQVDRLLDEARTTSDNAKRMEMYKQIQRRLVDLQTDIFGYDNLAVFAKQASVKVPALEDESKTVSTTGANWLFRLIEVN
ncbi:ABC transporter substrate-binding protein, partial [Enterobacter hormaechei]|uniref:ABC transporter substrate-binding protein n=1 Tax=Enterobacter hormaechei TaxID=158836 RepID=UPI001133F922